MDEAAGTQQQQQQQQAVNLDEIKNLSEDEFKQQLLNWIETNCVGKSMQSKLRKDLIDNFNRTTLGRQIAFHHQQSHRIVLSSLILALNTLVAEFLYAQNCHFSLSVFSTEVPYKNTMPDFENVNNFRFSIDELTEIFEALGLVPSSTICKDISAMYSAQGSRVNTSLLYGIFKVFTAQIEKLQIIQQPQVAEPIKNIPHNAGTAANLHPTDSKQPKTRRLSRKTTRHQELNVRYFKHLSSYLDLLAKHIIEMNRKMENLKFANQQQKNGNSMENCEKIDNLNRTLDKITENLTNLSKTNRQGKKLSAIIKCIRNLTTEIEKCSESFQQLSTLLHDDKHRNATSGDCGVKSNAKSFAHTNEPNSYAEWLREFNASPFSKIYLADIERKHCAKIDEIRTQMTKDFDEKIEINRRFVRLHYKEKMLEKCKTSFGETLQMNRVQRENFNEMIDNKLKMVKDLKVDCVQRQNAATSTKEVVAKKITKDIGCGGDEVLIKRTNASNLSLHKAASINIAAIHVPDPVDNKENEGHKTVNESPPYPDYVVQYARQRLQELECESDRLDKSFQSYLQRQEQEKQKIDTNVTKIWENYAIDKQFLNQTTNFIVPNAINLKDVSVAPIETTTQTTTTASTLNLFDIHRSLATDTILIAQHEKHHHIPNDSSLSASPINLFQNPYRQISLDEIRLAKTIPFDNNKKKMIHKKMHAKLKTAASVPIRRVIKSVAGKKADNFSNSIIPNSSNKKEIVTTSILPKIISASADEISNVSNNSRSAISLKNDDETKTNDNQMIIDTKEPEPEPESEPDDEIIIASQISAVNLNEPPMTISSNDQKLTQLEPTAIVSSTTFLINRNQSNEYMINDDYIDNNQLKIDENDDVLSIGGKHSDSSDDFWK